VGEKNADTALAPPDSKTAPAGANGAANSTSSGDASKTAADAAAVVGSYYVQVAAVSRQEDAVSLVEALKNKQYPAFSANNPATDKFFHVQVGPYADLKEAEAMKARLVGDGYNPIVKK
jgi:cell division septation protein DedD